MNKSAGIDDVIETILEHNDDIHVVVGPTSWTQENNGDSKWYFVVSVSKAGEWHSILIEDHDYEPPARLDDDLAAAFDTIIEIRRVDARSRVISALMAKKPIVVHSFDDELEAAKWCEGLWPGQRIAAVRKAIEQERAQWSQEVRASS